MRPNVFNFKLDTIKQNTIESVKIVSGDNKMNLFVLEVEQKEQPFDLTGKLVMVVFSKTDGTYVSQSSTDLFGFEIEGNVANVTLAPEVTSTAGRITAEVSIFGPHEERLTTQKFKFSVRESILDIIDKNN